MKQDQTYEVDVVHAAFEKWRSNEIDQQQMQSFSAEQKKQKVIRDK